MSGSYSLSPANAQLPRSPFMPRLGSSVAFSSDRLSVCMDARFLVTRRSSSAVICTTGSLAAASVALLYARGRRQRAGVCACVGSLDASTS